MCYNYFREVKNMNKFKISKERISAQGIDEINDVATADDIKAIEEGEKELKNGETISHNDIDWN